VANCTAALSIFILISFDNGSTEKEISGFYQAGKNV
jgi:hypothetical protein